MLIERSSLQLHLYSVTVPLRQFRMPYLQVDLIHIHVTGTSTILCPSSRPFPRFRHLKFPFHLLLFWAMFESLVTQNLGAHGLSFSIGNHFRSGKPVCHSTVSDVYSVACAAQLLDRCSHARLTVMKMSCVFSWSKGIHVMEFISRLMSWTILIVSTGVSFIFTSAQVCDVRSCVTRKR